MSLQVLAWRIATHLAMTVAFGAGTAAIYTIAVTASRKGEFR